MNGTIYSLFIAMALRVTVITAFVLLIKAIFRQKLSAAAHCAVWIIPAIQVVFCIGNVSIPTRTSIYNVVSEAAVSAGTAVSSQAAYADVKNIIAFVYCAGAAALALWYLAVSLVHRVRISRLETVTDAVTLGILRELVSKLGIRGSVTLRSGKTAQTIGRTVILPPGYTPDEQRQILLHELCHLKNRDNAKLTAAAVIMCLNWFNPLMWYSFRRFRADVEMYCDDNVIRLTESRKGYAMVLVKTASRHSLFIPGATGVGGGKNEVARRVKRIVSWKKKRPAWLAAAVCACVTVSCLCLTDAVSTAVENNVDAVSAPEPIPAAPVAAETVQPVSEPDVQTDEPEPQIETAAAEEPKNDAAGTPTERGGTYADVPEERGAAEDAAEPAVPDEVRGREYREDETEEVRIGGSADTSADAIIMPPDRELYTEPEEVQSDAETEDIPSSFGEPESVSANGNKETYTLDDGRTAVLHYDDGELETGYIINGTQAEPEE